MARPYRLQGENCLYHVISRGDDRKKIYTRPAVYSRFMDYVIKAKERFQFSLYACCGSNQAIKNQVDAGEAGSNLSIAGVYGFDESGDR